MADRITTPFDATSTAAQVIAGVDLRGRRAIVTGAASGIGLETARALAGAGAHVTLAVRDPDAGNRAASDITASTGNSDVRVARLDLADRASIDAFTGAWSAPLHVLVNNAGVMALPELRRTPEGRELQFATNHLGHFALALGLHDALVAGGSARVVVVSSSGHLTSPVIFDDLDFRFVPYDPWVAYGQSKSANALFAVEAHRRWSADGITVNAVMPGAIPTRLQRHLPGGSEALRRGTDSTGAALHVKTPEQGAATSVLVATSPLLEGVGGRYFEDCGEAEVVHGRTGVALNGVAPYALDPGNAERLWDVSLELLAQDGSTGATRPDS